MREFFREWKEFRTQLTPMEKLGSIVPGIGCGILIGLLISLLMKLSQISEYLAILVSQG